MTPLRKQIEQSVFEVKVEGHWSGRVIDVPTALGIAEDGDARISKLEAMLREFVDPPPFAKEAEEGRCGPLAPLVRKSRNQRARELLGLPEPKPEVDDDD